MSESTNDDTDCFLVRKAACRAIIARAVNDLLSHWTSVSEAEREELQRALVATMADITAECALGVKEPTREKFLQFMGRSWDYATRG